MSSQEQFPDPIQQPQPGDYVPSQAQEFPAGAEYMAPEAHADMARLPEAGRFADLSNDAKVQLYRTDRFNRLAGQAYMPLLQEYIDSPGSDVSRQEFSRNFTGELSERGNLLDSQGNETNYRPDSIGRFRVDPAKEAEALEAAYMQLATEKKMAQAIDEIGLLPQEHSSIELNEIGVTSPGELQQKQAERDKFEDNVISNFVAHGAIEAQIQAHREIMARMKNAELKRGRLFPHQAGFVRFEALAEPERAGSLDIGIGSGYEQGDWVNVRRSSGEIEHQWTFMGVDYRTGLSRVAGFDEHGGRMYKDYPLTELDKLNQR